MKTALLWFRRDLRLTDNPALREALKADRVVPVFIWDPEAEGPWAPGAASRWWLHQSLAALDRQLRRLGCPLVIRSGRSAPVLAELALETRARSVFWNRLYEPALVARDRALKISLRALGLEAESFNAALLIEPWDLKTGAGEPYRVFTPFWKSAVARIWDRDPEPAPTRMTGVPGLVSEPLESLGLRPRVRWDAGIARAWTPGESGAFEALDRFADEALSGYATERDFPGRDGTSRLSPHLHFGEISPRQIAARIAGLQRQGRSAGTETYLKELGWREFAHHLLFHFPQTPDEPLDERFRAFPWRRAPEELNLWQRGHTGLPIVDAGMRQLWETGWMHNRVRMIAASLLTKNLLLPWQDGARWFWDTLVDADLASNTLGWQWTAGCGADAAPFFRIFNPVLQSRKFDPQGRYLRRWLPELNAVPDDAIHEPQPGAIVDLLASRHRALDAFARIKKTPA